MEIQRKRRGEELEAEVETKRARMGDRLGNLPDCLQLHILSFLDTNHAVQTSVLSRTWVRLWTLLPVLELNCCAFKKLPAFDKFVNNVLSRRDQSANLERLTFTRRGVCSAKGLQRVLDYAFSHGAKQLEASIQHSRNRNWPVCLHTSSDSLTSLKLQSESIVGCSFLGSRPGSFKNLTVLYLEGAQITDSEAFSGFPKLAKLTLHHCHLITDRNTLSIRVPRLSDLTISSYQYFNCYELTTPELKFFEYRGCDFPVVKTHQGLPVLETVVIDFHGVCYHTHEKQMFNDLLRLFSTLQNAKSLSVYSSIIELLSLFRDEMVTLDSPFSDLRSVKLDFTQLGWQNLFDSPRRWSFESLETIIPSYVKAYLLQNSPNAEFTMILPPSA